MDSPEVSPADRRRAEQLVGTTIADRYRLNDLIAVGGMGSVFRGEHIRMRKRVAIKVLHAGMADLPDLAARFEREAVAGAHINHPNVASATDFGEFGEGSYYLVLEYVEGITLHELIKQGPVDPARAVHIARQVAAGLGAGHKKGVVHRDVKPRNIMLAEGNADQVKLIDYGFARVPLDRLSITDVDDFETNSITQSGMAFGTIAYMAPEIAQGMEHVDERSDLYALGIILYEMLAGKHPFDGIKPGELFLQQRTEAPPPIRLRSPQVGVPQTLEAVVMKLMRKDPMERFPSADALLSALVDALPQQAETGLIPWTSQLKTSVAGQPPSVFPASLMDDPASQRSMSAAPPPLPSVPPPYRPKLITPERTGRSPWSLVAIAIAVAIGCTVLVLWLRGFRSETSAPVQPPPATDEVEIELEPPQPTAASTSAPSAATPNPDKPERDEQETGEAEETDDEMVEDLTPEQWRKRLGNALADKEWDRGAEAILALAKKDPDAFAEKHVATPTAAVAVRLGFGAPDKAERVLRMLAVEVGPAGPDILYDMVSGYGGSAGAKKAYEQLLRKEVEPHMSEPLRIAMKLRTVPCDERPALFETAAEKGDVRAWALLDDWSSPRCRPQKGHCCFREDARVEKALARLKERGQIPPP